MNEGTVTWYDAERGYGFIEAAGGTEVFVHVTAMAEVPNEPLRVGNRVRFTLITDMGPRAADVVTVSEKEMSATS